MKTIETINDRVKRLRAALNKSQKDFGASLGIKPNSVSDIETGKNKVTEQNIKAICLENWDGKKINESWLRTGEGGDENMFLKEFLEDEYMAYVTEIGNGASDIVKKAIIKYGRLSPQDRKIIDNALELAVKMIKEE
ncbi:MAG: helix-turn-helix transcriptional regulator [Clostridiales bacterium]|nr:helix-turn-helix transcriptional regulator [Clostridiales bacterium]DAJ90984.1 MAG TPA: Helix-turn-helix XRE-family like protein [Caudoviricetes sp.]